MSEIPATIRGRWPYKHCCDCGDRPSVAQTNVPGKPFVYRCDGCQRKAEERQKHSEDITKPIKCVVR